MRFSHLRKLVRETIFTPELNLDLRCTSYRLENGANVGRYWIVLDGQTIWSYPDDIEAAKLLGKDNPEVSDISAIIRSYLDTPKEDLLLREFPEDRFGLTDILKASDRRIGKRRLPELKARTLTPSALRLIAQRNRPTPQ